MNFELKRYFWDVEIKELKDFPIFVMERLLEYGDRNAISYLLSNFSKERIKKVVKETRRISRKSANFWAFYLNIPKKEVKCLKRSFQRNNRKIWKY
ncbi:MAG: hypothetical protein AB1630_02635 [bacterium]